MHSRHWVRGKVRLCVLWGRHSEAKVVARDEAQLVKRVCVLLTVRAVVFEELLNCAEVAMS
jgi:hypothetical protein